MVPNGEDSTSPGPRRVPAWAWAGAVVGVGIVVALIAGAEWRTPIERGLAVVRAAGPGWYFLAMAVVPLPLAWFTVPAGEAFAAQLTLGGVVAAALAAVAVQQALSYWAARAWLRPAVERWVRRRGQQVPSVTPENALGIALIVRLTPGPPMILGSCVLALAGVPFGPYLVVSWLVALPWVCAGVMLGRGLFAGNAALVASGLGLIIAAAIAARLIRRRQRRGPP